MANQHTHGRFRWLHASAILLTVCLAGAGCGRKDGPPTVPVAGKITLDGEPVAKGEIIFKDFDGKGKACAGPIRDGNYSFPCTLGKKKIEISSMKEVTDGKKAKVGGILGDPVSASNPATELVEAVPAKYNSQTTLTVDVATGAKNDFPFDLKTRE